jgi:hypothetical protein
MKKICSLLILIFLVSSFQAEAINNISNIEVTSKTDDLQPSKKIKKKRKKRKTIKSKEDGAIDNKISISEENQPTTKKKKK